MLLRAYIQVGQWSSIILQFHSLMHAFIHFTNTDWTRHGGRRVVAMVHKIRRVLPSKKPAVQRGRQTGKNPVMQFIECKDGRVCKCYESSERGNQGKVPRRSGARPKPWRASRSSQRAQAQHMRGENKNKHNTTEATTGGRKDGGTKHRGRQKPWLWRLNFILRAMGSHWKVLRKMG